MNVNRIIYHCARFVNHRFSGRELNVDWRYIYKTVADDPRKYLEYKWIFRFYNINRIII